MFAQNAQRLFADSGMTFSTFVLEQRLLAARLLLLGASEPARRISDIAYSSGFGDLSYFNRSFRKRFGLTPSEMLHEAQAIVKDPET